jgi:hypothetical protein
MSVILFEDIKIYEIKFKENYYSVTLDHCYNHGYTEESVFDNYGNEVLGELKSDILNYVKDSV